jgi:hypothetical protein
MRRLFIAAMLAAAAPSGASAQRYALEEFDLPQLALIGSHAGTVEAVCETPITGRRHPFEPDVFEHRFRPETRTELVIRLDDGSVITVPRDETLRPEPGQRVRVF